jgi:hypothetical protein
MALPIIQNGVVSYIVFDEESDSKNNLSVEIPQSGILSREQSRELAFEYRKRKCKCPERYTPSSDEEKKDRLSVEESTCHMGSTSESTDNFYNGKRRKQM